MNADSPSVFERNIAHQDRISCKERISQYKACAKRWVKQRRTKSRPLVVAWAVNISNISTEQANNSASILGELEARKAIILKEVEEI